MSIFNSMYGSTGNYNAPAYEGYSFEHGGAQDIAMENAIDNLAIMEALHGYDVAMTHAKASSGVQENIEIVQERAGSKVGDRIKQMLKKLWGRVKAFFASIVRVFDGLTKSGEDFVRKYRDQIRRKDLSELEVKTTNFTNIDTKTVEVAADDHENITGTRLSLDSVENMKKANENRSENLSETLDIARGRLLKTQKVEAGDFSEEVNKYFYGGESSMEDATEDKKIDVAKAIKNIEDTKNLLKAIENASKKADREFNKAIKTVDDFSKEINKLKSNADLHKYGKSGGDKGSRASTSDNKTDHKEDATHVSIAVAYLNNITSEFSQVKNLQTSFLSTFASKVKQRYNQSFAHVRRAASYSGK